MKRKKNGFGAYLQELRTAAGWTLRDLSKASGVSPTHLWSIEHGTSPKLESLAALSRVFKQPLHRFIRPAVRVSTAGCLPSQSAQVHENRSLKLQQRVGQLLWSKQRGRRKR